MISPFTKMSPKIREGKGTKLTVFPSEPLALPDSEYRYWRDAIANDDDTLVSRKLQSANWEEKERLLNGYFLEYDSQAEKDIFAKESESFLKRVSCLVKGKKYLEVSFERPWCLAGASGSLKVMSVMYQHGVKVDQTDNQGSNILHILVYLAFLDHSREEFHGQVYEHLLSLLTLDQLELLLKAEGKHGLYPLEMAAWLGTFTLYYLFFRTEGIYMLSENIDAVRTVEKYDVTDYESGEGRKFFSPLNYLMLIDDKDIGMDDTNEVFQSEVFKNWLHLKKLSVRPFLVLWVMIRLIFAVAYTLYDTAGGWNRPFIVKSAGQNITICQDYEENISDTFYAVLTIYIFIHSAIILITDLIDFIAGLTCQRKLMINGVKTPNGWKDISLNYGFYRGSQMCIAIACLIGTVTSMLGSFTSLDISWQYTNYLYMITSMNLVWSLLFFLQLSPFLGYFVIAVQAMMMDLFKFAFIFIAFAYPYSETFARLVNQGKSTDCPKEFQGTLSSFYSTFTIMINLIDFQSYNVEDPSLLYLLHCIYVFMVPILLLNFLVALFSNSVSHVQENKEVFRSIQWLSVLWLVEYRLGTFITKYKERCNRVYFLNKGGRLYVPVITMNSKKKGCNDKQGKQLT